MTRSLLPASLLLGALVDAAFALAILFAPEALSRWTGLALPSEPVYLQLCAILLLILAMFYVVAASAVGRVPSLAAVAAAGRLLGFFFFFSVWRAGFAEQFLAFAVLDLFLAVSHGGFLLHQQLGRESVTEP